MHRIRAAHQAGAAGPGPVLAGGPPARHSPLFPPPHMGARVFDGRLDLFDSDVLVYEDEGEEDIPVLFPPDRVRPDPAFRRHGVNLLDDELGLSGRPDFIVQRAGGAVVPIEYKATHLFHGWRAMHLENHGRTFDLIQAIAECRLVQAVTGQRPPYGIVLYGDRGEEGEHEGWVEIPYGESEEHWLRAAVTQIRTDRERSPVPGDRTCPSCEPNRDSLCSFAAARYSNGHADNHSMGLGPVR